jgi:hypothetical protein
MNAAAGGRGGVIGSDGAVDGPPLRTQPCYGWTRPWRTA